MVYLVKRKKNKKIRLICASAVSTVSWPRWWCILSWCVWPGSGWWLLIRSWQGAGECGHQHNEGISAKYYFQSIFSPKMLVKGPHETITYMWYLSFKNSLSITSVTRIYSNNWHRILHIRIRILNFLVSNIFDIRIRSSC